LLPDMSEVTLSAQRSCYGRDTSYFETTETVELEYVASDPDLAGDYVPQNPRTIELDTATELSLHTVNTEVVRNVTMTMSHGEGGWPKDIDPTEKTDVARFRKKAEKDEAFRSAIGSLGPAVSRTARVSPRCGAAAASLSPRSCANNSVALSSLVR